MVLNGFTGIEEWLTIFRALALVFLPTLTLSQAQPITAAVETKTELKEDYSTASVPAQDWDEKYRSRIAETTDELSRLQTIETSTIANSLEHRTDSGWFGSLNRALTSSDPYQLEMNTAETKLHALSRSFQKLELSQNASDLHSRVEHLNFARNAAGLEPLDPMTLEPTGTRPRAISATPLDNSAYEVEQETLTTTRDIAWTAGLTIATAGGGLVGAATGGAMKSTPSLAVALKEGLVLGATEGALESIVPVVDDIQRGESTVSGGLLTTATNATLGSLTGGLIGPAGYKVGELLTNLKIPDVPAPEIDGSLTHADTGSSNVTSVGDVTPVSAPTKAHERLYQALDTPEAFGSNYFHGSSSGSLHDVLNSGLRPLEDQQGIPFTGELITGISFRDPLGQSNLNRVSAVPADRIDSAIQYSTTMQPAAKGWDPQKGQEIYDTAAAQLTKRGIPLDAPLGSRTGMLENMWLAQVHVEGQRLQQWSSLAPEQQQLIREPFPVVYGIENAEPLSRVLGSDIPGDTYIAGQAASSLTVYVPADRVNQVIDLAARNESPIRAVLPLESLPR